MRGCRISRALFCTDAICRIRYRSHHQDRISISAMLDSFWSGPASHGNSGTSKARHTDSCSPGKDACIRFEDKVILSKRSNPNPPFSASVLYWQIQDNKSGRQTKPDAPSVAGGWLCRPHDFPGLRASCESRVACLRSHLGGENCLGSRHGWNCPAVM